MCFLFSPQFRSLFAATCSAPVVKSMWDIYLLEDDPFMVFFLALVIVINSRLSIINGFAQGNVNCIFYESIMLNANYLTIEILFHAFVSLAIYLYL